jgi:hypothetical protein
MAMADLQREGLDVPPNAYLEAIETEPGTIG